MDTLMPAGQGHEDGVAPSLPFLGAGGGRLRGGVRGLRLVLGLQGCQLCCLHRRFGLLPCSGQALVGFLPRLSWSFPLPQSPIPES